VDYQADAATDSASRAEPASPVNAIEAGPKRDKENAPLDNKYIIHCINHINNK